MEKDLRLDAQGRHAAVNIFRTSLEAPGTFTDFARQFYSQFYNQPQLLELMIDILIRVAVADGSMTSGEETLIQSAVKTFNFSSQRYEQLKSQYVDTSDTAYAVLGCQPNDSDEQVKRVLSTTGAGVSSRQDCRQGIARGVYPFCPGQIP